MYFLRFTWLLILALGSCNNKSGEDDPNPVNLTIFFVNDQHGQIGKFDRVKTIVDEAKANGNAVLVSAGDIFSGNPIVDYYDEKGFPMIDVMNQTGFDVGVLGNHEFDYGLKVLEDRIKQSEFPWILANVNTINSSLTQPDPYVTLKVGELTVTFLGLVETDGKDNDVIPSTHPLRVADLTFQRYQDVVGSYAQLKADEDADLLIALTHLGSWSDRNLARDHPYFDLIIGGHSHELINETVNNIPIVQAGSYLNLLGKIELSIINKTVTNSTVTMINLDDSEEVNTDLTTAISTYNDDPLFSTEVGYSAIDHTSANVGCFYTTAIQQYMEVDFSIQNMGGLRAGIDQGPITRHEIYSMDPFNNRSVTFTKTVREFESFFCESGSRFHVSGVNIDPSNGFHFVDENGTPLPDNQLLTLGVNDYIPAVFDEFFNFQDAEIQDYSTAEAVIGYLENINATVDFERCSRIYRCD